MAADCLYVQRQDLTWAHSLFCPRHPSRGAKQIGGWPTAIDRETFVYATGPIGLDPDSPSWTREA